MLGRHCGTDPMVKRFYLRLRHCGWISFVMSVFALCAWIIVAAIDGNL
jgi:hypothetical protein